MVSVLSTKVDKNKFVLDSSLKRKMWYASIPIWEKMYVHVKAESGIKFGADFSFTTHKVDKYLDNFTKHFL